MPCYDPRNEPEYLLKEARADFRHNSDVAQMLCTVLQSTDPARLRGYSKEIQQWWAEHQARDKATPR